ncbi:unnamed protein product [Lactuca saligna]|uniref:Uncharacterized protein n=1 Tax=Lactuca saligna TaxID=75948 RepID=A0AA35Y3G3_LACSI|nr:unnamed protein product [Lactuca saligna]
MDKRLWLRKVLVMLLHLLRVNFHCQVQVGVAHSWFCNCWVSQKIVPKLTEVLTDTHPQVQSAWQTTLQQEVQNLAKKAVETVVLVIDDEGTEYLISELLKLLLFPC